MHFPPELVHLSAGRFREPIINAREEREDRSRRDDVMEMRDDVIGVVQIKIGRIKRERNAGQPADSEHRQKRGREKHRHIEPNRAAPERNEKRAQNNHRRNRDDHRGGLEKCAHRRAHAGQPHVMRPDDEGEKAEHEHGEDERFVTPERFARVVRDDFGDDAHARQNQHVNFRMPEEPEQDAATAADCRRR